MAVKVVIDGRIVAEPETKVITDKFSVTEFPLYSDRRVKNRDTNEWESDPNGTTKLRVVLKFDQKDAWEGKLNKGDIIKVTGSIYERSYENKEGKTGRSLETDFIESIEVIKSAAAGQGINQSPTEDTPW